MDPEFRRLLLESTALHIVRLIKEYDVDVIEVVGHTDEQPIGNRPSNPLLSQRLMLDGRQHFERQDRTAILKRSRFQLRCETGQTLRRPRRQDLPDARRPLRFCPSHAAFAVDDVSSLRRPLWRRAQDQAFLMPRSVSLSCLRATDLAREPARHRSVSSRAILQALPSGFPQHGCPQHLGERQRRARLAHLRRLRPTPHRHRAAALCRRSTGA